MKIYKSLLIIITGFFLIACEDVVEADLDTAEPRLVIDASINWIKNTPGNEQKIRLSTTTAYYSNEFPAVSGADITIKNSANTIFNFVENPGTGEYICTYFEPVIGETYTLTIYLNGETYTATETLMGVPHIENTIDQNNTGGISGDETEIIYYYQDNAAQENYYLNSVKNPHIAFPEYRAEDDQNNQGNLVPIFYSNKNLKPGDTVHIQLFGISKRYFDYFRKLLSASGNNNTPFPTTPTSIRGNIINQTHSENFAYGYFRLSEADQKNYVIQ